eukprot:TRINITY_DN139_c9_g1_i1.p1 TRINITY_DN139_c9_g1~~TRINITY_DN139_c9_g1_i1.p1  ORF type:complete len:1160 (+),score=337.52 TRINITY_DN139_c9_g1_i1:391-3480(+)
MSQYQLNKVNDSGFKFVTKSQIGSINGDYCASFPKGALGSMSMEGYSGLKSDCLKNMRYCSTMTSDGISNIAVDQFKGFGQYCVQNLSSGAFSKVSSDQLKTLTGATCSAVAAYTLQDIPDKSYAGFTKSCVSLWGDYNTGCKNAKSSGFHYLTSDAYSGLPINCIYRVPDDVFSEATAAQITALATTSCNGLRENNMKHMSVAGYSGLTADCLQHIYGTSGQKNGCYGFTGDGLAAIPPASMTGMQEYCFYDIPVDSIKSLTKAQAAVIPSGVCDAIKDTQFAVMSSNTLSGFTNGCIANFKTTYCAGIKTLGPFSDLSSFQEYCLYNIPATSFSYLSAAQVATLSPAATEGIKSAQFKAMKKSALHGFKSKAIAKFKTSECGGIQSLGSFDTAEVSGFQTYCIYNVESSAFKDLTSDHIKNFSDDAVSQVKSAQFAAIPYNAYAGFKSSQVKMFKTSECSGIVSLQAFNVYAVIGIQEYCMYNFDATAYDNVDAQHIAKLNPAPVSHICAVCTQHIPADAFAGFSDKQVARFSSSNTCPKISADQFSKLTPAAIIGFTKYCVGKFDAMEIFTKASSTQLASFHDDQCQGFPSHIFDNIDPKSFSGFTNSCIKNFSSDSCKGITEPLLNSLTQSKFPAFTTWCVNSWPTDTVRSLTKSQVNGLSNGIGGLMYSSADKMEIVLTNYPDLTTTISADAAKNLASAGGWNDLNDDYENNEIDHQSIEFSTRLHNLGIFFMPNSQVRNISPSRFGAILSTDLAGFREGHAKQMSGKMFAAIDYNMASKLEANFWLGLDDERIQQLSVPVLENIPRGSFGFLSIGAFKHMTNAQYKALDYMAQNGQLNLCEGQAKAMKGLIDNYRNLIKAADSAIMRSVYCPKHHYPIPGVSSSSSSQGHSSSSSQGHSSSHHHHHSSSSSTSSSSSSSTHHHHYSSSSGSSSQGHHHHYSSSSSKPDNGGGSKFLLIVVVLLLIGGGAMGGYIVFQRRQQNERQFNVSLLAKSNPQYIQPQNNYSAPQYSSNLKGGANYTQV